jgi:hypothetical protein
MPEVSKIVRGLPFEITVQMPTGSVWFPSGSEYKSQFREYAGAPRVLATLTTAGGGIVRVSDRELKFVLSAETTQKFSGESVIFDYIRTDTTPDVYGGYIAEWPVHQPVTEPA